VEDVLGLVPKIWNKFLAAATRFREVVELVGGEHVASDGHLLGSQWIVIVRIVQVGRVVEIHLQNEAIFSVIVNLGDVNCSRIITSLKVADGKGLAHGPGVQRICVQVD
jgi:hypothetical protein